MWRNSIAQVNIGQRMDWVEVCRGGFGLAVDLDRLMMIKSCGCCDQVKQEVQLKLVQAYVPMSSYEEKAVDSLYEEVKSAMNKANVLHTTRLRNF